MFEEIHLNQKGGHVPVDGDDQTPGSPDRGILWLSFEHIDPSWITLSRHDKMQFFTRGLFAELLLQKQIHGTH